MHRLLLGRCRALLGLVAFLPAPCWGRSPSPQGPEILHDPIECWPQDEFLVLRATFRPASDVQTAKAYFRSDKYPDFYYVVLTRDSRGQASAVMPKPDSDTTSVIYYLEGVSLGFTAGRSAEWNARVADPNECKRREPEMMLFNGEQPNIAVGATQAGLPQVPPGFQAVGITKVISAAGVVGNVGGGGLGVKLGIAAGGAAAAIVALTAGGDGSSTSTTPGAVVSSSTTSSVPVGGTTSTSTTTIGGGGSTTTIIGGSTTTVVGGSTTTVIGSSTTTVVGSSTTTIVGSSTTTSAGSSTTTSVGSSTTTSAGSSTTTSAGSSTTTGPTTSSTTTTVGSTTTTTSVPSTSTTSSSTTSVSTTTTTIAPRADLSVSKTGPASAQVGVIFDYNMTVTNGGPSPATGVSLVDTLPSRFACSQVVGPCSGCGATVTCNFPIAIPVGGNQSVRIRGFATSTGPPLANTATVSGNEPDPNTGNNSATVFTTVTLTVGPEPAGVESRFTSFLEVEPFDGTLSAQVLVNGAALQTVDNSGPVLHILGVRPGENTVEAYLDSEGASGFWRFDLSDAPHFVAGSLRVEQGELASLTANWVVFRLSGTAGERVKFAFSIEP